MGEIVLVMKLPEDVASRKCMTLGVSSALMIVLGYPGELIVEGALNTRWMYWGAAMVPFCYIVFELMVGLAGAKNAETNDKVKALVFRSLLHRLRVDGWPGGRQKRGDQRQGESLGLPVSVGGRGELADLPRGLRLPYVRLVRLEHGGGHPVRVLRFRHHLQVRCRPHHLQHYRCQVRYRGEGSPAALVKRRANSLT